MNYKDWKQYDPEHLKDIQKMIDDPYTDVPKQDVIFLVDRFKEYKLKSEELQQQLQALQANLSTIQHIQDGLCKVCIVCGIVEKLGHLEGCWLGEAMKGRDNL